MNKKVRSGILYVFFTGLLILFLVPFFLVLINSFKTNKEIILSPMAFPSSVNLSGYVKAFFSMNCKLLEFFFCNFSSCHDGNDMF